MTNTLVYTQEVDNLFIFVECYKNNQFLNIKYNKDWKLFGAKLYIIEFFTYDGMGNETNLSHFIFGSDYYSELIFNNSISKLLGISSIKYLIIKYSIRIDK